MTEGPPPCGICAMMDPRNELILYEDDQFYAMHHPLPAALGHIILFPKAHVRVIEEVTPILVGRAFTLANKLSTVLFESLAIQGTNILVQNGAAAGQGQPHFMVHIIPRRENDGVEMTWTPKEGSDDDLATAQAKLRPFTENLGGFKEEKKKVVEVKKKVEELSTNEQDYRLKQLRRLP